MSVTLFRLVNYITAFQSIIHYEKAVLLYLLLLHLVALLVFLRGQLKLGLILKSLPYDSCLL